MRGLSPVELVGVRHGGAESLDPVAVAVAVALAPLRAEIDALTRPRPSGRSVHGTPQAQSGVPA